MSENNNTTPATAAAASTTEAPKFRADLLAHADKLRPTAVTDSATGIISIPAEVYYANAPAGVTQETDLASAQYRDLNVNTLAYLSSELGAGMFAANPKLETVVATMPVRKNTTIETSWNREGTSRNPGTGEVTAFKGSLGVRRFDERSTRPASEMLDIKRNMRMLMPQEG